MRDKKNKTIVKNKKGNNKTRRQKIYTINRMNKSHIVKVFIEMLNMVKLYHWKTRSHAQHKATDELYSRLNEHIDSFVEIMLGKDESRIEMLEKRIDLLDFSNVLEFKKRIYEYRDFLTDMNVYFDPKKDTDLLNVRDEILGDINQFLYLMTFDK
jgi:DNA-binding ferritin-like protein